MMVVRVPEEGKDVERGKRCRERCHEYSGVMAAFIHHLLATGRAAKFADEVGFWQDHFHEGIATAPNGLRVAANAALIAAALFEWADFLKDAVPESETVINQFVENDLMVLRDETLGLIRGTGVQPTYLAVLNDLVREERSDGKGLIYIGDRLVGRRLSPEVIAVSIPWSLELVNREMAGHGWQTFEGTHAQLMDKLRDEGVLCDDKGHVIPKEAAVASKPVWMEGRLTRSFLVRSEALRLA
jgi:hypothetical protein